MYSNQHNIDLPIAVWLASDTYDLVIDPNTISATTLLKPLKSIVLSHRAVEKGEVGVTDLMDLVASSVGTAVHTAAEVAWDDYASAMKLLDIPQKVIDSVRVNPEVADPENLNIYVEQRTEKEINGFTISGKFDFVYEDTVHDIKTTKVYNWINGGNNYKYGLQGSIYRWLNPEIILNDTMKVQMIFTDWSPLQALAKKDYPKKRIEVLNIPLHTLDATEKFILDKTDAIRANWNKDQEDIPKCTPEEVWQSPTKYAYYANPSKMTKATKLFDSYLDASQHCTSAGGTGIVVTRPGEVKFCVYCPALSICKQAKEYIEAGLLKI